MERYEWGEQRVFGLSDSELLLYGGIGAMAVAAVAALSCAIIFTYTGKKLKEILKKEYGDLRQ